MGIKATTSLAICCRAHILLQATISSVCVCVREKEWVRERKEWERERERDFCNSCEKTMEVRSVCVNWLQKEWEMRSSWNVSGRLFLSCCWRGWWRVVFTGVWRLLILGVSCHCWHSINEFRLKQDIGIVKHSVFQGNHNELGRKRERKGENSECHKNLIIQTLP